MKIAFSIKPNNNIPAFAGYLSGSVKEPEAKIVVNIEAMVNAAAEYHEEVSFEEIFTTSVVHEMLHAIQELYGREFDESEVERAVEDACSMFYGQKTSTEPAGQR